jgi:hypothetical protein
VLFALVAKIQVLAQALVATSAMGGCVCGSLFIDNTYLQALGQQFAVLLFLLNLFITKPANNHDSRLINQSES